MQTASGDEPVYVISVAARLAGLPCWVLRVLDQEGIVVPVRTDSNRRLYSDNDITLLARVRYLTEERGVNIAGVKVILEIEKAHAAASAAAAPPLTSLPARAPIPHRERAAVAAAAAAAAPEGTPHDLPVRR
jgi:MerR family transcriptional regulator/heat shock protein HspR